MENNEHIVRALVRVAVSINKADPKSVLLASMVAINSEIQVGKILIGATEAGGGVNFAVPNGYTAYDQIALLEQALEWIEQQPDPTNMNLSSRLVKKINFSFGRKNFGRNGGGNGGWNTI